MHGTSPSRQAVTDVIPKAIIIMSVHNSTYLMSLLLLCLRINQVNLLLELGR